MGSEPQHATRNGQAADAISDLRALMASLRENVEQLNAILATPEVPDGNPATA